MEKYKIVENKLIASLKSNFNTDTKESVASTFQSLWVGEKEYKKHLIKRMNTEKVVKNEHDYIQKTFNALNSKEVYFEIYDAPDLWDRVFYSNDDNWAVVVAQNGKILTSYKIKSTIQDTINKHIENLGAKTSKIGVSNEFRQTVKQITEQLRKF
jgi:hypothetical protein